MDGDLRTRAFIGWNEALASHPFVTAADLLAEVERGEAQHWAFESSDVFTRLDGHVLEIGPVSGDLGEMIEKLPLIEAWGAQHGAREVFIQGGRQAWSRVLRVYGYEEAAVILRKEL